MTFDEAKDRSPTVYTCIKAGLTAEQIVGVLAEREEAFIDRIIGLECICPKLIRSEDGRLFRIDIPTELLPQPP